MKVTGLVLGVVMLMQCLRAVIAPPFPIIKMQPDGSVVELYLRGDEWQHWFESPDGYTAVKNAQESWVYAVDLEEGKPRPGVIKVGESDASDRLAAMGVEKHLRPARKRVMPTPQGRLIRSGMVETFNIPVILVDFPDQRREFSPDQFDDMMNERGYRGTGSFKDYYEEVSYGQLSPSATVVGWFTARNDHDYYGGDSLTHQLELVQRAVDEAEAGGLLDWSQFDNDDDGDVDVVVIIHAGRGGEEGDDTNIWSFFGRLSWQNLDRTYDNVKIDAFTMQPEKFGNDQSSIGVFVHEFGHGLDLPDLYDTDESSEGIGVWGVMGAGSWGGDGFSPHTPTHFCAWSKTRLRWLSPDTVDSIRYDLKIDPIETNPIAYRIDNPSDHSEYFFLVNRQKSGFDRRLPGKGLLIWHMDEDKTARWPWANDVNAEEPHYGVGLEQADGKFDLENGNNRGDSGDPFPGLSRNVVFDNNSTPNSASYESRPSYVTVHNIALAGSTVSVDIWLPGSGAPYLTFESFSILETDGDGDGLLNPGETAAMRIVLSNLGAADTAREVVGEISSDDPDITFLNQIATFFDIRPGVSGVNVTDPFEFAIAKEALPHTIPLNISIAAGGVPPSFELFERIEIDVTLNQVGFPFSTSGSIKTAPSIVDIDGDGENEVIAGSDDFSLYVLNRDGDLKWSFLTGNKLRSTPAVGDIDRDGDLELVFGSMDKNLYILNSDGSLRTQFATQGFVMASPAIKDMDGDGTLETIFGDHAGFLYVLRHDGKEFGSFPVDIGDPLVTATAVADLDGDGDDEIVLGSWSDSVYVLGNDGSIQAGFPYATGDRIDSDPALADLNGDGRLEIVVGSDDDKLHVIDHRGSPVFVYETEGNVQGSPAVDDLDGDGEVEIFFGSNDGKLYGIDSRGNDLPGWPYESSAPFSSAPVFLDLDNDGIAEIVSADANGALLVLRIDGTLFSNFPVRLDGSVKASFSVSDLDGDGDAEIAFGASSDIAVIDVKSDWGGNPYWWSMYRGNAFRTGFLGDSKLTVKSPVSLIPASFSVFPNYPNPFNPLTTINYQLPERSYVSVDIYNLLGEHVIRLFEGYQRPGSYRFVWDSGDSHGIPVSSGIYFLKVRAGKKVHVQKMTLVR